jgi:hypothetical protein
VALACVVASLLLVSAALADAGRAGHPDPSFDRDGKVVVGQAHSFANAVDVGPSGRIAKGIRAVDSVAIDPRDRIVGAGPHLRHGRKRYGLARLLG